MANIPKKNVQDMKGMKIDIGIKSFLINLETQFRKKTSSGAPQCPQNIFSVLHFLISIAPPECMEILVNIFVPGHLCAKVIQATSLSNKLSGLRLSITISCEQSPFGLEINQSRSPTTFYVLQRSI